MNVSKSIEEALEKSLITGGASGGIKVEDVFYNLFQDTDHDHAAEFPQIEIIAAPDVPDGQEVSRLSPLRRVAVELNLWTQVSDDKTRAVLVSLYDRVRSAIDDANKDLTTWSSANLPSGWYANCVLVEDSSPPYFDADMQAFGLAVMVEVCVS